MIRLLMQVKMEIPVKSFGFVDNVALFICTLDVSDSTRFINHPKKALFDFEWQRMIAARLQMNPESTRNVLKSLSKAYSMDKQYNEALNCYRELLRDIGSSDKKARLEIISKIGPILQNTSPVFNTISNNH